MSSSSNQKAPTRKSRGRQKVSMVKMENHSNLQVTFSKRRAGLFKKASELCTLCGAEAALVVFSPANKVYCFGHPNVKTLIDRVALGIDPAQTNPRSHLIIEAHRNSTIREQNIELTRVENLLRAERRRAEEIELVRKANRKQGWLTTSLDNLDFEQLCKLEECVAGFKKSLDAKVKKDMLIRASSPLPSHHRQIENPNPNFFTLGVGSDHISRVPTFDLPKLSLAHGHLPPYVNGVVGSSSVGRAPDYPTTDSSNSSPCVDHCMRANYESSGAMCNVGGSNGASSMSPNEFLEIIGSRGVGFGLAHAPELFQMF